MDLSPVWSLLGPLAVLYAIMVVLLIVYAFFGVGTMNVQEEKYLKLNIPFGRYLVEYILWVFNPFEKFCRRFGITPNMLTLAGTALACVGAVCYAKGQFIPAAWALAFGGIFDTLDGHLARRFGQDSRGGAFLDSTLDRYTEGVIFIGIAAYYRDSVFFLAALAALVGSMLVSYSKARGEGLGLDFKGGFLKRSERVFYLFLISAFTPIADLLRTRWPSLPPEFLFKANLVFFAAATNLTAFYRIYNIHKTLDRGQRP